MRVDRWIHDLRDPWSLIRDQGNRPTCLAVATSTAHQIARNHSEPFAADALWLHALTAGAAGERGTTTIAIKEALREWGQPMAANWPYELPFTSTLPPESAGDPPWLTAEILERTPTVDAVLDVLSSGIVPVVTLTVYDSFYLDEGGRTLDRLGPEEAPYGNHAVCMIGYVEDDGDEWFVTQNSWGEGWGETGLALVSPRYLAATLVEVVVVSPSSA